jgi:hypothetical protein
MSVSKAIAITIDNELVERCDRLRIAGRLKHWSLKRFREMIIEMGMDRYMLMIPSPRNYAEETPAQAQPETPPRSGENVIPFPGVTIDHEVTYQNALDGFLREIGYID